MSVTLAQPNAAPLPDDLIASLTRAVAPVAGGAQPRDVVFRDQHSNDVAEIRYSDGRTLMVKRGRYDWVAPRFRTSRRAAELLRHHTRIRAPRPLEIPAGLHEQPVEAYWRIDLPTLQDLWPTLGCQARDAALRSWGAVLRDLHSVELHGFGPIHEGAGEYASLTDFLEADLGGRLYPAVAAVWGEGLAVLERLRSAIPAVAARAHVPARLLHNDLHMGNVLCEAASGAVACVGLLDLETAIAGPAEADLASVEVHHGPLFAQPLAGDWFAELCAGYARDLDPFVLSFFRAYHLINMGFYSALVGHAEHAADVAAAARREVGMLQPC